MDQFLIKWPPTLSRSLWTWIQFLFGFWVLHPHHGPNGGYLFDGILNLLYKHMIKDLTVQIISTEDQHLDTISSWIKRFHHWNLKPAFMINPHVNSWTTTTVKRWTAAPWRSTCAQRPVQLLSTMQICSPGPGDDLEPFLDKLLGDLGENIAELLCCLRAYQICQGAKVRRAQRQNAHQQKDAPELDLVCDQSGFTGTGRAKPRSHDPLLGQKSAETRTDNLACAPDVRLLCWNTTWTTSVEKYVLFESKDKHYIRAKSSICPQQQDSTASTFSGLKITLLNLCPTLFWQIKRNNSHYQFSQMHKPMESGSL